MPATMEHNPLDLLNPETNGGNYYAVSLCPGLDFVFVRPGPGIGEAPQAKLFYEQGLDGFSIEEASVSGSVPFLRATNSSAFDVLLIAGQLVKGGKQNRGINTDILVGAGKTADIPVTCVEQGRWSGRPGDRFRHGGVEPIYIRSSKLRDVSGGRRGGRGFVANQQEVWSSIARMSRDLGAESAGGDLLASLKTVNDRRQSGAPRTDSPRSGSPRPDPRPWSPQDADRSLVERIPEIEHLERRLRMAQDEAQALMASLSCALRELDTDSITNIRRRLDATLREVGITQSELERARAHTRRPHAPIPVITPEALEQANDGALGAAGMLVFFNGEFLAGDLFANHEWFARFYGDLRDSALMTWDMVAHRRAAAGLAMHPDSSAKAKSLAQSIVGDALRGAWIDRPTAAQGRSQMLEHPYLEGAALCDGNDTPLHVLVGSKQTPEILRA